LRESLRRLAGDTHVGQEGRGERLLCLKGTHHWGVTPGTTTSDPEAAQPPNASAPSTET
jgi:hypothetical protein